MSAVARPKLLRKGVDYDLVNISLLGYDPVTGRSFEQCNAEWNAQLKAVEQRMARARWWQLRQKFRNRWDLMVLERRQGMQGMQP